MSIEVKPDNSDTEVAADLETVIQHLVSGAPLDAVVSRRVRERSERLTQKLRRERGELNVAVGLVREIRDEL